MVDGVGGAFSKDIFELETLEFNYYQRIMVRVMTKERVTPVQKRPIFFSKFFVWKCLFGVILNKEKILKISAPKYMKNLAIPFKTY